MLMLKVSFDYKIILESPNFITKTRKFIFCHKFGDDDMMRVLRWRKKNKHQLIYVMFKHYKRQRTDLSVNQK